jgi:hypothetical protein
MRSRFVDEELWEAAQILNRVLEETPNLIASGFSDSIRGSRAFSPDEVGQFILCRRWLRQFKQLTRVSKLNSSYGLKHRVEKAMDEYIQNGALIAAAIAEGIQVQRVDGGPNAWFAIEVPGSSIKAMRILMSTAE